MLRILTAAAELFCLLIRHLRLVCSIHLGSLMFRELIPIPGFRSNHRFFGRRRTNLRAEVSSTDRTKRLESILALCRQIDGAT